MKTTLLILATGMALMAQAQSDRNIMEQDDYYMDDDNFDERWDNESPAPGIHSVHRSRIMYQKTITRSLNLKMKPNLPLFADGKELSRVLLEAAQNGCIRAYDDEELTKPLSYAAVKEKLLLPAPPEEDTSYMNEWEKESYVKPQAGYFTANQLYDFEIKEGMFFDKQRSKWAYDIQSITMFIPADNPDNEKGYRVPVASFKFSECAQCFKNNPGALWYNVSNDAEHRNLAEAFELRLFYTQIVKISGPKDEYLSDRYPNDPKMGLMASDREEKKFREFESNLYEN